MNKNICSVVFLLVIKQTCFSQNYIEYYNYCNEGEKQIYLKNFVTALNQFEKAFTLVDYIHSKQYKNASICAAKVADFNKTYVFAKKSIINGNSSKFLKQKAFKQFRKSDLYKQLKDSISIFHEWHYKSINLDYKKEIDSLHYIVQGKILE